VTKALRFQDALDTAIDFAKNHPLLSNNSPVIIRDLYGKIRLFLQIEPMPEHKELAVQLSDSLSGFGYPASELFYTQTISLIQSALPYLRTKSKSPTQFHPFICLIGK